MKLRLCLVLALVLCTQAQAQARDAAFLDPNGNDGSGTVRMDPTTGIDFGNVKIGAGTAARTILMINDSADPMTIFSIDAVAVDHDLRRLDQGCAVDKKLAPGASCPVTLVWLPKKQGSMATDVIVHHSGASAFTIIPVQGSAVADQPRDTAFSPDNGDAVILPPVAQGSKKVIAGKKARMSQASLGDSGGKGDPQPYLIGTIGDKALILKPNGDIDIFPVGGEFDSNGNTAKIVAVTASAADIIVAGRRKTLVLQAAPALVDKAAKTETTETMPETK